MKRLKSGDFFKMKYGVDPKGKTPHDIDRIVEKKSGKKLEIKYANLDISSCRGSIFPIK